jgi:DNA-binding PadR family transcriptional regulator
MDILSVFEFKKEEFDEKSIKVILSMLSNDEKKVFNLLKLSPDALTATQIYDLFIDTIIKETSFLNKKKDELESFLNVRGNKKPLEVKAEFARKNNVSVPTNRTITRILENLKDSGFIVKRKPDNKKAKAYYCLTPKLRLIFNEYDTDVKKKKEVEFMLKRVKEIKEAIKEKK